MQTRITQTIFGHLVQIYYYILYKIYKYTTILQKSKLIQGYDFTEPLKSRDQVPVVRRPSLSLEAMHCVQLQGIPVNSSGHPDYVKKGIYTMGINEFSPGLYTIHNPMERLRALQKSLLLLLQKGFRNLLVLINMSICLVWEFSCITTDLKCNTSLIAA